MTSIALATARTLPKPEVDTALLADALASRGVEATIVNWDDLTPSSDVDLVVIRSTWDYHERREEFIAWATAVDEATRLVNPIENIRWTSHKEYLAELPGRGVPAIPTVVITPLEAEGEANPTLSAWLDGQESTAEFVVKPAVSVGGFGAERVVVDNVHESVRRVAADGDVVVQPLVESVLEYGEVSVILFDGDVSHAVRKVGAPGDFRIHDHHGGRVLDHTPDAAEIEAALRAIAAAPAPSAYARADLLRGPDGPLVIEIELIEPQLFLDLHAPSAARFADVLLRGLDG